MNVYRPHNPPAFCATVGTALVERTARLPDLLAVLEEIHELHVGIDDVAIWAGNRLVAVWLADGRRIDLAGPPPVPAA